MERETRRYEYYGWTPKGNPSNKFWQIERDFQGGWKATWGKIGRPQGYVYYSFGEGLEKAAEKVAKGYRRVGVRV